MRVTPKRLSAIPSPEPQASMPSPERKEAPGAPTERRAHAVHFVDRIHRLRTLGLALGALCAASVLRLHEEPIWLWLLLIANSFVWPHVAKSLAMRSVDPMRAELRNLMVDSACGGAWVAIMQFN